MKEAYDRIGRGYAATRRSEPRILDQITSALGDARSVLNVGAGAGSYEPADRVVVAVEPSPVMLAQRHPGSAPVVRALAEDLPFGDRSFDAAMSVLSTHHWTDPTRGFAEMRRVARRRVVVLTFDVRRIEEFWVVDYFPFIAELDRGRLMPVDAVAQELGGATVVPVPIPANCVDGFLGAFWRRPEVYLDPDVRRGISSFAVMPAEAVERGRARLERDLADGTWKRRFGHLLQLGELDMGYRLVIADCGTGD